MYVCVCECVQSYRSSQELGKLVISDLALGGVCIKWSPSKKTVRSIMQAYHHTPKHTKAHQSTLCLLTVQSLG